MKYTLSAIIGVYALVGISTPASAQLEPQPQRICGPLQGVLKHLADNFKEFPVFVAKQGNAILTITRSNNGSWTLIDSNGTIACVIATGETSEIDRGV